MAVKFFGQYLVERSIISRETLLKAVELQEAVNLRFGEMALAMGFITEADVDRIHKAQWKEDLPFGEMSVKLGILNQDQLQQVLTRQKNNHIYIGEALFKVGGLDQEELKRYLEEFKADQKPYQTDNVSIPQGIAHPLIFEIAADLTYKMLTRIAQITFRQEAAILTNSVEAHDVVAAIQITGNYQGTYVLGVSFEVARKVAIGILGGEALEEDSEEFLIDGAKEFVNIVCGNMAAKAAQLGKNLEIHPPEHWEIPANGKSIQQGKTAARFPIQVAGSKAIHLTLIF